MMLVSIACAFKVPDLLIKNVICGFDRLPQLLSVIVLAGALALLEDWLLGFEK